MKVKLLKKMRSRFEIYCDPNRKEKQFVLKFYSGPLWLKFLLKGTDFNYIEYFNFKENIYLEYRIAMIKWSGKLYDCHKKETKLPIIQIKHAEI